MVSLIVRQALKWLIVIEAGDPWPSQYCNL